MRHARLADLIVEIHAASRGVYGARLVHAELTATEVDGLVIMRVRVCSGWLGAEQVEAVGCIGQRFGRDARDVTDRHTSSSTGSASRRAPRDRGLIGHDRTEPVVNNADVWRAAT